MLRIVRGGVATAVVLLSGVLGPAPAQAYWYGGYYGYGPRAYPWAPPVYYRPLYRPFYPTPVVVVPPPSPVYFAPPHVYAAPGRPVYVAPRRVTARAATRAKTVRRPCNCATPPSAFSGSGAVPASVPGRVLPLAPAPRSTPDVAPAVPIPGVPAEPPPNNAYPPERPFTPFTGD